MAVTISQLPAGSALSGSEQLEIVQSSASKRTTAQDIANLAPLGEDTTPGLDAASSLTGTELVEVVQGGSSKKTTVQDIADLAGASGGSGWTDVVTTTNTNKSLGSEDLGTVQLLNCTTNSYAITLPASSSGNKGKRVMICLKAESYTATIARSGSDTFTVVSGDIAISAGGTPKYMNVVLVDLGDGRWAPEYWPVSS